MDTAALNRASCYLQDSIDLYKLMQQDHDILITLIRLGSLATESIRRGGKIIFAGNGGSAADAQHFAGELVSRFYYNRPGIASLALTTDTSIITSIANDYNYDQIFARQIEALGRPEDLFIGISTSGCSRNVLVALETARRKGLSTASLTGYQNGEMDKLSDVIIHVPSDSTPLIQQGHLVIGHLLCALIEEAIHPKGSLSF